MLLLQCPPSLFFSYTYLSLFLADRLRRRVPDRINIYPSIELRSVGGNPRYFLL